VNCETIAISKYSVFAGLPVSIWGLISFGALLALIRVERGRKEGKGAAGSIALLGLVMSAGAITLGILSFVVIKALCIPCIAVYLIIFLITGTAVTVAAKRSGALRCFFSEMASLKRRPVPFIAHCAFLALVVACLWLALPHYWSFASLYGDFTIPHGFDEKGNPWLGAIEPKLVIHEYLDYECPACKVAHLKLRRALEGRWDEIRLVRHDYARMPCLVKDANALSTSCQLVRAAHCAGRQGRYWEWNAAVFGKPKPLSNPERKTYEKDMARLLGLDIKAFERCMVDERTISHAHGIFKDAIANKIMGTPSYMIDGKHVAFGELIKLID
jgi:hypothetical protein